MGSDPTIITAEQHGKAFDFFNRELFSGRLSPCLITLSSGRKTAKGYYRESFFKGNDHERVDELGMNPETYSELAEYLSTLVHEMVHHEQKLFGKPGKAPYHNKQWSEWMLRIGLRPESLDRKGKMTGRRVTHAIVEGGSFDIACRKLITSGFTFDYTKGEPLVQDRDETEDERKDREEEEERIKKRREKAKASKTPFYCTGCGAKIWGKPTTKVMCVDCKIQFVKDDVSGGEPDEEGPPKEGEGEGENSLPAGENEEFIMPPRV